VKNPRVELPPPVADHEEMESLTHPPPEACQAHHDSQATRNEEHDHLIGVKQAAVGGRLFDIKHSSVSNASAYLKF